MDSTTSFPYMKNGVPSKDSRIEQATNAVQGAVDSVGDAARPLIGQLETTAHQTVDSIADAGASVQAGATQAHDTIHAAVGTARPRLERVLSGTHNAVETLSRLAVVAAETVGEKSAHLKDAHVQMMAKGRMQVREKPAVAIGLALATGFILGRILKNRQSRDHLTR